MNKKQRRQRLKQLKMQAKQQKAGVKEWVAQECSPEVRIIRFLHDLGTGRREPPNRGAGVCWALNYNPMHDRLSFEKRETIRCAMLEWPGSTGHLNFPVPGTMFFYRRSYDAAALKFEQTADKWIGWYGRKRRAMCRWIAAHLNNKWFDGQLELT